MKTNLLASGIFAASTLIAVGAFAHSGATGIVKERMDGMMAMGKALGSVADMFKGKTSFDAATVAASAKIVGNHAEKMASLFPGTKASREGSGTEALPAIWDDQAKFSKLIVALEKKYVELASIAATQDQAQVRRTFSNAGGI